MSSKRSEKSKSLILPGERLGVIEEYAPESGTFVRDGVIYSKVVGKPNVDLTTRRVSVQALTQAAKVPKVGDTILGQVSNVQSENATVRIFQIGDRQASGEFAGVIHISDVDTRYVESMFDICKAGDIIRAKIISEKNHVYHLSTKDKDSGVLYAFCSACGGTLELRRQDLRCSICGRFEQRKVTSDFGKGLT